MKIRTSELIGNALNWAVEMIECEGAMYSGRECRPFCADWAVGGPILEREKILLDLVGPDDDQEWEGRIVGKWMEYGPTPLVAAMRCYVGMQLGNEVDVPEVCLNDK